MRHRQIYPVFLIIINPFSGYSSMGNLEPVFEKDESFAQIYTITGISDNGIFAQVQFVLTNLGISDQNGACKMVLSAGSGKPVLLNQKFNKKQWTSSSRADTFLLRMGENCISVGNGSTRISAGDTTMKVDFLFERTPHPFIPPGSSIYAKRRFFRYWIPIQWMPAKILVTRRGVPIAANNWYAMVEISRSTTFPVDICRSWITFRGFNETACFNASIRIPQEKDAVPAGWIWGNANKSPVEAANVAIDIEPQPSQPNQLRLRRVAAKDYSFELLAHTPIARYSFIDELGPVLGAIVKLVVGVPVVYYYHAAATVSSVESAIPGVMEYMRIE